MTVQFGKFLRYEVPTAIACLDWGAIALVLVVKALILVFGAVAYQVGANYALDSWYQVLEIWNRWDAPHYVDIAHYGYEATGDRQRWIVFFPLFPWLVRGLSWLTREYVLSGFLVSGIASIAAALLLQGLIQVDDSRATSRVALWFFLIFPTSYFLHIGYTESLFIALMLGSLLAARRGYWWLAGLLGLLASLSRISGIILLPTLLVEAVHQGCRSHRSDSLLQKLRSNQEWLWIALVPVGTLLYLVCNYLTTGDPFAFLIHQREYWHKFLAAPWVGIGNSLERLPGNDPWKVQMVIGQELVFGGLGAIATLWTWLKLRPAYGVWMLGNWLLFVSTSHILSVPRYTLVMFPVFWLFARMSRHQLAYSVLTVWSLLFLGFFISEFVQGHWAF